MNEWSVCTSQNYCCKLFALRPMIQVSGLLFAIRTHKNITIVRVQGSKLQLQNGSWYDLLPLQRLLQAFISNSLENSLNSQAPAQPRKMQRLHWEKEQSHGQHSSFSTWLWANILIVFSAISPLKGIVLFFLPCCCHGPCSPLQICQESKSDPLAFKCFQKEEKTPKKNSHTNECWLRACE